MTPAGVTARWNSAKQHLARARAPLLTSLVTFHVLTVLVLSLPGSGRLGDHSVWQSRENQLQFARWSKYSSQLGLARDGAELEELAWSLTQAYLRARRVFATPFEAYAAFAGVRQGWRMFSNPQSHPGYVHIELRRGAEFEPIYVSRSDDFDWRRAQFDHHRVRKLFGRIARSTEPALWDEFGAWAARQAAADFPDAAELRIWQERRATAEPGMPAEPAAVSPEAVRTYELREFR
jgi:hypothetical protein